MDAIHGYLGLDIETSSAVTPKDYGAWAYTRHDSTVVYCAVLAYATRGSSHYEYTLWEPGDTLPAEVEDFIHAGGSVVVHNKSFEHAVSANILVPHHDWPVIALDQWVDTQALGLALNLPKSLGGLGHALGCPVQKDAEGAKLMKAMAKAERDAGQRRWVYPLDTPANRRRLAQYCRDDVGATLDAFFRMPPLSVSETLIDAVDRKANERGVFLDQEFAETLSHMALDRSRELAAEVGVLTGGELLNATSTPLLKQWLIARDVDLPLVTRKRKDGTFHKTPSADKTAIASILKDFDTDPEVRTVLSNRVEANKTTSLAKLSRVHVMTGGGGRLHNALQYMGAHTGRWTSYGLQIHNLPKDKMSAAQGGLARLVARHGDLELLKFFEARPLATLSQLLRSVIAAAPGREIIGGDFSAIEARVLAWLADDFDKIRQFERGSDIYVYTAESIGSTDRQLGKISELALGYGMGKLKFADTGGAWGIAMPLKEWGEAHTAWRTANPLTVATWRGLEDAVRDVIAGGEPVTVHRIGVSRSRSCLMLKLPSGRVLRYWRPRIVNVEKESKTLDEDGAIVSKTWETDEIQFFAAKSGKMRIESTYGGKLVENVTQAIARDLLGEALVRIDALDPYQIVMHVHDSIAAEVPTGEGCVDEFCFAMAENPSWAGGLPLSVEGYRDAFFQG